ncbi:thioredoxin family protein [Anaerosalibacter bizertensis]|uniref:thioredoxin family protein n=1 Tax=Anaerosalibacter bizertensis TaxID=932217 RepID=UPI001C0EBDBF|nr:thioredoxin family protein [Anaerosalibacter bizertensis]MBU5292510.1 thioredoxin family protein [Anaerosalibacter bizertensis]
MDIVDSNEVIKELINENKIVLLYFGSNNCGVCTDMQPKVEEILKKYSKIKSLKVDVEKSLKIAASYNIFTIPAILLFIEGKETIREARHISIQDIDNKILRYYNFLFDNENPI